MHGPNEDLTNVQKSHDDSPSRVKPAKNVSSAVVDLPVAARSAAGQAGMGPAGAGSSASGLSTSGLSTSGPSLSGPSLSGQSVSLDAKTLEKLSTDAAALDLYTDARAAKLSSHGQSLLQTEYFRLLVDVPNCTVTHSGVLSFSRKNTRGSHCIDAAARVRELGPTLGLTPKEVAILELAMLLHDPHVKGGHGVDRFYSALPGAPKDFSNWWSNGDYHEYHGALLVARDPQIRKILGQYGPDVLALLSSHDLRPLAERERDYGPIRPTVSPQRLEVLKALKDEFDRCSYMRGDYICSGFRMPLVQSILKDIARHEASLCAKGSEMVINIARQSDRFYKSVFEYRTFFRVHMATLPVGDLVERAVFHEGIWEKMREVFPEEHLSSPQVYEYVKQNSLKGNYEAILSRDSLDMLEAAQTGLGLTVEDRVAPLVTMTLADVKENAFEEFVSSEESQKICGLPRLDMTKFEAHIRTTLKKFGLDDTVYVLVSNDFSKKIEYDVSVGGQTPSVDTISCECPLSDRKVVVAAPAIRDGKAINLAMIRSVVNHSLRQSGLLLEEAALNRYNPRIFCEVLNKNLFSDWARAKIEAAEPEWIKQGGCGLL